MNIDRHDRAEGLDIQQDICAIMLALDAPRDVFSTTRRGNYVPYRWAVWHRLRSIRHEARGGFPYSYPEIASATFCCSHSSVLEGCQRFGRVLRGEHKTHPYIEAELRKVVRRYRKLWPETALRAAV